MNNEEKLLSLIIQRLIYTNKKEEIRSCLSKDIICWEDFKKLILYHDLAPFAYRALKDFGSFLPHYEIDFLKSEYFASSFRTDFLWSQFIQIYDIFLYNSITCVPLKGISFIYDIYQNEDARPMVDIDILIREENIDKATDILRTHGYEQELLGCKKEYWKNHYHITFSKNREEYSLFVEMHWALDYKRNNSHIVSEVWQRIRCIPLNGKSVTVLSPEDNFLSLALHNRRFGKVLILKNVLDINLLLQKYAAQFDWEYVLRISRKYDMRTTVFFALYVASFFSEKNIPIYIWKALAIPSWKRSMIHRFASHNIFDPNIISRIKQLFLKSHFILYDNICDPVRYILTIPQEQFAKFYNFKPYDKKTEFLYKNRLLYIPWNAFFSALSTKLQGDR